MHSTRKVLTWFFNGLQHLLEPDIVHLTHTVSPVSAPCNRSSQQSFAPFHLKPRLSQQHPSDSHFLSALGEMQATTIQDFPTSMSIVPRITSQLPRHPLPWPQSLDFKWLYLPLSKRLQSALECFRSSLLNHSYPFCSALTTCEVSPRVRVTQNDSNTSTGIFQNVEGGFPLSKWQLFTITESPISSFLND